MWPFSSLKRLRDSNEILRGEVKALRRRLEHADNHATAAQKTAMRLEAENFRLRDEGDPMRKNLSYRLERLRGHLAPISETAMSPKSNGTARRFHRIVSNALTADETMTLHHSAAAE